MKKGFKCFLIVLAVILILVCSVGTWQWNNIVAVYKTFVSTPEDLKQELDANKKNLEAEIERVSPLVISDFTSDDEDAIVKGKLSVEQAVDNLKQKYTEKKETVKNEKTPSGNAENSGKTDELIGDKMIELYSLKAYYLGQLGQMEANVKKEYAALPKEKKNIVGKQAVVNKYMGTATGLLNQCDAQFNRLVSELRTELKKLDGDLSIIKTITDAYENEKAIKKARYLKLLNE